MGTWERKREFIVKWHASYVTKIKNTPSGVLTDEARRNFRRCVDYVAMSFYMSYDIVEKNPMVWEKVFKGRFTALLYSRSMSSFSAKQINLYSSIMVKDMEVVYKFMVNEAKTAGVPVLTKMPPARNSTESMT